MVKPDNKLFLFFIIVTIWTIFVDQITKWIIFYLRPAIDLKILTIHYLTNTGAGFGILQDKVVLLAIISILVATMVLLFYKEIPSLIWPQLSVALFLGGVIGNLIDRLFRGLVIDFIHFSFWPAFNLADMAITVGVIGIIFTIQKNTS